MLKQTSFSSPSVERRCSPCGYGVLLLGFPLLLLASRIISAAGKGKPFIPATGLAFPFGRGKQGYPPQSGLWSRIAYHSEPPNHRRTFFRVFSIQSGKNLYIPEWRYGVNPGSPRTLTDPGSSACKNAASRYVVVDGRCSSGLHLAWLCRHRTEWVARSFHGANTREANIAWTEPAGEGILLKTASIPAQTAAKSQLRV